MCVCVNEKAGEQETELAFVSSRMISIEELQEQYS